MHDIIIIISLYWMLGNLPPGCNSTLSSIYLAALIKSTDLKCYGYDKVLQSFLNDLVILERKGIFVSKLGRTIKGTVHSVWLLTTLGHTVLLDL